MLQLLLVGNWTSEESSQTAIHYPVLSLCSCLSCSLYFCQLCSVRETLLLCRTYCIWRQITTVSRHSGSSRASPMEDATWDEDQRVNDASLMFMLCSLCRIFVLILTCIQHGLGRVRLSWVGSGRVHPKMRGSGLGRVASRNLDPCTSLDLRCRKTLLRLKRMRTSNQFSVYADKGI